MERNSAIDITKYFAAILVIAIHTQPLENISHKWDFLLGEIICRIAVPFFAICTGYYLTLQFKPKEKFNSQVFIKVALWKIGTMYIGWSIFYFAVHLYSWHENNSPIITYSIGWLKSLFYSSSYYHLWYLIALFYALMPFYLILRYIIPKYYPPIIGTLWFYQSIKYGYFTFMPERIQPLLSFLDIMGSFSTGITLILPLLLTGTLIAYEKGKTTYLGFKALTGILLLTGEVILLKYCGGGRYSFIFLTLPVSSIVYLYMLQFNKKTKIKNSKKWAKISMTVYCLHPFVIYLLNKWNVTNHLALFVFTTILTTILSIAYYKTKTIVSHLNKNIITL